MRIASSVTDLIGGTPLVRLNRVVGDCHATILGKLESANPGNSVKDRIGLAMIMAAEKSGDLVPGKSTIVEPTSGNTGIALSMVAAVKGYPCVIVMPDTMSPERRATMRAFGAKIVLTEGAKGMRASIETATEIANKINGSFMPQQFRNPANPDAHFNTTAQEIWDDTEGTVDALVAGVGTGGTITGVSRYIKPKKPDFKAIAVEPDDSPILSGGSPGPHKIQGIGPGFVPDVLETDNLDGVVTVSNDTAVAMALRLAQEEGVLCGLSSGANVAAAIEYGSRPENAGKTIVTMICDFGERYIQTILFENLRYDGSDSIDS
ncbi:MAG: cysteine synthase A [Myxococcales bacterium]|nr:cysteine synthase A [Myxococcales bacterium]HIK84282.1 cysteine synthase A [Myxococcales bacterium]